MLIFLNHLWHKLSIFIHSNGARKRFSFLLLFTASSFLSNLLLFLWALQSIFRCIWFFLFFSVFRSLSTLFRWNCVFFLLLLFWKRLYHIGFHGYAYKFLLFVSIGIRVRLSFGATLQWKKCALCVIIVCDPHKKSSHCLELFSVQCVRWWCWCWCRSIVRMQQWAFLFVFIDGFLVSKCNVQCAMCSIQYASLDARDFFFVSFFKFRKLFGFVR